MDTELASSRRARRLVALTVGALVTSVITASAAQAVGTGITQSKVVSAVPSTLTPNISDGTVYAITEVGNLVIAGGSFSSVANHGSTTTMTRTDVLAFDASTGEVSTTFAPVLDGTVRAVAPGPTANTVYVGGFFNNVNGVKSKGVTLLNTQTGAIVSGFKPPALNGVVYSIATLGTRVYIAGSFTSAGGTHAGIATLNATTGAIDPFMNVQFAGHHNYNGTGANGAVGPRAIAINPAGTRLMAIGNFKTADGLARDQAALIDLDGTSASVDPNWATLQFTAACFRNSFDTYMTDVQYSADGSYFAITATGGSGTNVDGTNSLCDTASRWTSTDTGSNVKPAWVDYTGQDTLWSVAITGNSIYVGGHQRWLNNTNGHDSAVPGAVPRPGIGALDPDSGVPLSWNPGRNPRGAGAYALFASADGLYVGSDTDYIGDFKYKRQKIAFFPLADGADPASKSTAQLPSNLYEAGQLPTGSSNVLYRVDAGGPSLGALDNGPDWMADATNTDPGAQFRNTGNNVSSFNCCASLAPTVPSSTPVAMFNSERWDPSSGAEMTWQFPVSSGTHVGVRLYFANRYSGTSQVGQRVFDVKVDGATVLHNYDIVADVGDQRGTMKEFDVTSPGTITIQFGHVVENPLVNGIELINLDKPGGGGSSTDDLDYRAMSGSNIGPLTTVPNTGIAWGATRGAFMVGDTIFYAGTDGNFYRASFDGTTVGTPAAVDPYDDPVWSDVDTGSGQTYRGVKPTYYNQMSSITGEFYSGGRLYYALLGQSSLRWRWFSPDSGIIGAQEFTVSGVNGANFSNIAGMVLSGSTLYYANRSDGNLHKLPFTNGVPDGSQDTVVSGPSIDGNDWRARGMFLYGDPSFPNQLPTASANSSCSELTCDFDGSASFDPDGSIASYDWNFGDGTHGTGATPSHGYAQPGTYNVSLVVTDNRGGQSPAWSGQVTAVAPAVQVGFVAHAGFNGITANPSVVVPAEVAGGDTELLYVSAGTVGVTTTVPSGWQQIAQRTNSPLETTVFMRVATAADAGSTVTVPLAASARVDLRLVAYSDVAAGTPVLATAGDSSTANHTAPSVPVDTAGSWVVSYWADRTSSDATWTLPASVTSRGTGYGTGGGRVDAAIGDSGGAVITGDYPSQTANSGETSGKGDMVSIVLVPDSGG